MWLIWNDFLEANFDALYPAANINKNRTPALCSVEPNSRPVPDPKEKIDSALANMVASGALSALDAILAIDADDETTVACSEIDETTSYYSSDDYDDEEEEEDETEFDSDDEDRLCDILGGDHHHHPSRRLGNILEECE